MPDRAFAGAAVFEAISHHRGTAAAKRSVILGIGPQIGRLRRSGAWSERRQSGFVGKDPFGLLDLAEDVVRHDLELEAELAHPLRHQLAVELDLVAGVDRLLPLERQAVGIFGDGDLGQKRFRRNASFDDMGRGRRLDHAVRVLESILGTARDDHTELDRHHI